MNQENVSVMLSEKSNMNFVILAIISVIVIGLIVVLFLLYRKQIRLRNEVIRAKAENNAKTEFLSRMSHEIRTPMNAIIGMTTLAKMSGEATEKIEDYLNKINVSSNYLLSLVNDVLDMSMIEKETIELVDVQFSLNELIEHIKTIINANELSKELNFTFNTSYTFDRLIGDITRLEQILVNLISNAIKYTKSGGSIEFSVDEIYSTDTHELINFSVKDTGIGIKQRDIDRIFQPFEQVSEISNGSSGTGLGLAISRSLINLMGGEIYVKSKFEEGTEFLFELEFPIVKPNIEASDDKNNEFISEFKGMKFLLAEDNELNVDIMVELLKTQGIEIEVAVNGQEAVDMFANSAERYYSVVLMDIQMPIKNGDEATNEIRHLNRNDAKSIPIIAISANCFKEDVERAYKLGVNDFIAKPVDMRELLAKIKKLL